MRLQLDKKVPVLFAFSLADAVSQLLWQVIPAKMLLALIPFYWGRISINLVYLYILSGFLVIAYILFSVDDLGNHDARAGLFISGLVLVYTLRSQAKRTALHARPINSKELLFYLVFLVVFGNLLYVFVTNSSFTNNFTAAETNRYRGYFPWILALAIVITSDGYIKKLYLVLTLCTIGYIFDGGRGAFISSILSGIAVSFLKPALFVKFLYVKSFLVYPFFLLMLKYQPNLSGSFDLKADGFYYLLNNIKFFGSGIQLPFLKGESSRADNYGLYFSSSDYGFFGVGYELGIIILVIKFVAGYYCVSLYRLFANEKTANIYILVAWQISFGYALSVDYFTNLTAFLLFFITVNAKLKSSK